MMYLPRRLSTGISRLVCVDIDVGIERLGKSRCRNCDQNSRGQNTFHFILLFDATWSPPWRFPTHVHRVAVNRAGNNGLLRSMTPSNDGLSRATPNVDWFCNSRIRRGIGTKTFYALLASSRMQNVRPLCGSGTNVCFSPEKRPFKMQTRMSAMGQ